MNSHTHLVPLKSAGTALALLLLLVTGCQQTPGPQGGGQMPNRLFLQQVTDTSAIIKWRGDSRQVCLIEGHSNTECVLGNLTEGFHRQATLRNLEPDTEYRYRLDSYENRHYRFRTAPEVGKLPDSGAIHLWVLGDSGTASELDQNGHYSHAGDAEAVKTGYEKFVGLFPEKRADMILMLGDNAYLEGTDEQWQLAVFDLYHPMLFQAALWPTIGNHEMGAGTFTMGDREMIYPGTSTSADPDSFHTKGDPTPRRIPYLDIFTLPSNGEVGGIPSGTEQYYAFDYGNIHVISLDSQLSMRDASQKAAMKQWLEADLQANDQDWTIVIFHHPPYSKGSHDSDAAAIARFSGIDNPMLDVRQEFTQIFEDYGVDMVYSGHSHAYERSWYLRGHRGDADSFDRTIHAELDGNGEPVSGRASAPYYQISPSSGMDDKVVYTVAGSAGKVDGENGELNHPAHAIQPADPDKRHGLAMLGSVHMEVTENRLTARFIDTQGQVLDQVEIHR